MYEIQNEKIQNMKRDLKEEISKKFNILEIKNSIIFSNLTSITLPNNLTSIPKNLFKDCSKLSEINLPSLDKNIEDFAFAGCSSLLKITIPNSVLLIGNSSFSGCSSLTKVKIVHH